MFSNSILAKACYTIILALPLIISGCGSSDDDLKDTSTEVKPHEIQVVYSDSLQLEMELPYSMQITTKLNKALPFQYMNGEDELYIVGNREDKEIAKLALLYMEKMDTTLPMAENYLNLSIDQMKAAGNVVTIIEKPSKFNSKNASGMIMQVDSKNPNIPAPIAYWYACYEYKGNMYKFIFWTLQSKKDEVRNTAIRTLKSIRFK